MLSLRNIFLVRVFYVLACFSIIPVGAVLAATEQSFTLFESGQVRPLAMSNNGKHLFAVNTPDNILEIFDITDSGLVHNQRVPVGLEPVAVAVRNDNEVWVVNHLSDSISVIKWEDDSPYVARTLLVGDEPRDIVFAGKKNNRAFITTAHRGQNAPNDPQLTTPGIGRADIWVFDADEDNEVTPITIIQLFTDTPRALAVSADGKRVYAAGFKTGNQTTSVWESHVTNTMGLPGPIVDSNDEPQPAVGLIVKYNGSNWVDELDRSWNQFVKFTLPDNDVFVINAMASPPAQISGSAGAYSGVGTVLFNMVVNPVNGSVYVSNTEAINEKRFEGLGSTHNAGTVRGRFVKNRITVIKDGAVLPRHLNKHIDLSMCCDANDKQHSLAQPTDMTISKDGKTLYVAAFGSGKIGVFDTASLEDDSFQPDAKNQVILSAGGPSGVVLDDKHDRLYVLTRFDNGISIIDTERKSEISHITMYNPEPASVVAGRPFLYDASYTSIDGNSSCAGCHIFGDMDDLAWDLGDPDGSAANVPGPVVPLTGVWRFTPRMIGVNTPTTFRALKGPMTTQSLRGMANYGPMHWRGDRTGGNIEPSQQPDSGIYNEQIAFKQFNPAFVGLVGRAQQLTDAEIQAFTDFTLQIVYPPNPIRALDNSLTVQQQRGRDYFFNRRSDTFSTCEGCHTTDPDGNKEYGVAKPGFFGSSGEYTAGRIVKQILKIPHLRNLYQKIGMFGMPAVPELFPVIINGEVNPFMGDQIRGFGLIHDGSQDTIFSFHKRKFLLQRPAGTNGPGDPGNNGFNRDFSIGDGERRDLESFLLAFPSNLAPIVGQQVTINKRNYKNQAVLNRADLLKARADAGECELVAQKNNDHGYLYLGGDLYQTVISDQNISDADLRSLARSEKENAVTWTCVPNGSGQRIAIDNHLR